MNGSDGDRIEVCQGDHATLPGLEPFDGQMTVGQLFCIKPTTKSTPFTTDDNDMGLNALCQVISSTHEILYPCPVSGIESLWTIEAEPCQVAIEFTAHSLKF